MSSKRVARTRSLHLRQKPATLRLRHANRNTAGKTRLSFGRLRARHVYMGKRWKHIKRAAITVCVLFLAVAAWAFQQYRTDIEQQWDRISRDSRIAETPCGPIEYAIAGSGMPILIV